MYHELFLPLTSGFLVRTCFPAIYPLYGTFSSTACFSILLFVLKYDTCTFFQMPELRARHDEVVMRSYVSREKDIEELKAAAQAEWEARKDEPVADLASLIEADLHGHKSEQRLGKESLQMTQASLLEATGGLLLTDDARQLLVMGVSLSRTFPSTARIHHFLAVLEYVFYLTYLFSLSGSP